MLLLLARAFLFNKWVKIGAPFLDGREDDEEDGVVQFWGNGLNASLRMVEDA